MTHLPNNEGRTPLMEAAATGFPEGVLLLLKNKAVVKKINHRDPQGMSSEFINHKIHDFGYRKCYIIIFLMVRHPILDTL